MVFIDNARLSVENLSALAEKEAYSASSSYGLTYLRLVISLALRLIAWARVSRVTLCCSRRPWGFALAQYCFYFLAKTIYIYPLRMLGY